MAGLTKTADVVVIGAGIAGLSVARALTEKTKVKVVVIEMEPSYACGSTGKAAGSVRRQLHTETLTKLACETTNDFKTFPEKYGIEIECENPGYLNITGSPETSEKLIRENAIHSKVGLNAEILKPDDIKERWNFIDVRNILVGTYSHDLNVDPYCVATALFKAARSRGTEFWFSTKFLGFISGKEKKIEGIKTTRGEIHTQVIVNAAGPWAGKICLDAGCNIIPPLIPKRRNIWLLKNLRNVPKTIPFIVDWDSPFYIRPYRELFLLSLMEEDELPLLGNDPPFDWEGIFKIEKRVSSRIPTILEANIGKGWSGWRTITPDDCPVLGQLEDVPGLFIAGGFGGHGIALAPSAGRLLASYLLGENSPYRIEEFSITRFPPNHPIPTQVNT